MTTPLPILPLTSPMVAPPQLPPAWESFIEIIEDGVCLQTLDARIIYANRAFAEMMGKTQRDILHQHCSQIFGCTAEAQDAEHFCARRAAQFSGRMESEELAGHLPGQRLRARISPVHNEQGELIAYLMIVRDITDVLAQEREQGRLEQLARFGELAAGLAHEIKNPLAGIQGAVDILLQRRADDDPEQEVLSSVKREVGRINNTVQLLLDRVRPRSLRLRPVSLTEIVQRSVRLASASLAAQRHNHVRIEFVPPVGPMTFSLDGAQVEDAILNLLLNAIDAFERPNQAGLITVTIQDKPADSEFVVTVTDNGKGIPAEDLTRIFSPFYTTHAHGTGLGLPAVKRIVRAHGGSIKVESNVGVGSSFVLRFPRETGSTATL